MEDWEKLEKKTVAEYHRRRGYKADVTPDPDSGVDIILSIIVRKL
jgi:hypothetical protein